MAKTSFIARALSAVLRPFGLACIRIPTIPWARELPDRAVENARVLPERADILKHLPKGGVVAEVGVSFGEYSRRILDALEPRLFVAIDTFELHRPDWRGRRPYAERIGHGTHEEFYRDQFSREIEAGQVAVHPGFSHDVLSGFPDRHFDMIYIDAGHDYESVRRDLEVARHKIKDDGFLVLNDYTIGSMMLSLPFGVVHAVNEFCIEQGWEIRYLALHPLMFCDVALARIPD